ncbi:hypothetical protein RSOL_230630 [Rhizoctonia solani AG-3 Rhs1AP]|uniref:Uncharacterized protein n=2 Tax=Rhizoctonia solani AG-3 TaxID=1086053 RepID=A0A074S0A6_9AGAM|nr:hypothetical protein RSOL_230630 [Rhizoctonia solani AG-3 Rhs1AP]KEP50318.1 hypothetical protein V565_082160 [Rhizoctonia solani 123E]
MYLKWYITLKSRDITSLIPCECFDSPRVCLVPALSREGSHKVNCPNHIYVAPQCTPCTSSIRGLPQSGSPRSARYKSRGPPLHIVAFSPRRPSATQHTLHEERAHFCIKRAKTHLESFTTLKIIRCPTVVCSFTRDGFLL